MYNAQMDVVSIHAPTQGATKAALYIRVSTTVSIHAPTQGATHSSFVGSLSLQGFNPRSHAGSDPSYPLISLTLLCFNPRSHAGSDSTRIRWHNRHGVSIHAPTQGATSAAYEISGMPEVSIHAPTQGATVIFQMLVHFRLFQSTLPRRERPPDSLYRCSALSFNPRSHAGSDTGHVNIFCLYFRFQSTLPRRERQRSRQLSAAIRGFQSTLPRRERPGSALYRSHMCLFQSTLPRRERQLKISY